MSDFDEEEFARKALARMFRVTSGDATDDIPDLDEPSEIAIEPIKATAITVRAQPQRQAKNTDQRDSLPTGMRFDVISRDDFTCQACGARPGNEGLHVDHLLPWSRGGAHHPNNLTTLCRACNLGKGVRMFIPRRLLVTGDGDGVSIWKRFGSWNIEVTTDGVIANWSKDHGYTWFGIENCWDSGDSDWERHFGSKAACVGCDDDCKVTEDNFEDRWHRTSDLRSVIAFMRSIYRKGHR